MKRKKQLTVIAPVGTSKVCKYLTDLKEYEVLSSDDEIFFILDDEGDRLACRFDLCAHLSEGLKWKLK